MSRETLARVSTGESCFTEQWSRVNPGGRPPENGRDQSHVIAKLFHLWERQLAAVTIDRIVRPFEWGLDWIPDHGHRLDPDPVRILGHWVDEILKDTDRYFHTMPAGDYRLHTDLLSFSSGYTTPHPDNNTVYARLFRTTARRRAAVRRAVLVLPQWNADEDGHVGLCRWLAWAGVDALRLSLPYHDRRMPPDLHRADYIVSANVGRTLEVCRQAVLDARRAIAWLRQEGYERIGILGTSLGSCLAMLTAAHEPAIQVVALNHISPFFADVVWSGLSTAHVRAGLAGGVELDVLRRLWLPISPWPYVERLHGRRVLLVYARYDLTFPVDLSRRLVQEFRRLQIPHDLVVMPCGHYSTAVAPFSWLDGFALTSFVRRHLR